MDTIASVVNGADYDDFISNYIWMSAPFKRNEFYQTHEVTFTCKGHEANNLEETTNG